MRFEKDLEESWEDMEKQSDIYKPSLFWYEAAKEIKNSLKKNGIESFRSNKLCLSNFVPTYGPPFNGLKEVEINKILEQYQKGEDKNIRVFNKLKNDLTGYSSAFSDYRVLRASDLTSILPNLNDFSESKFGNPKEQFVIEGRNFSRSSLNYLLGLSMLKRHINNNENNKNIEIKKVLEIGGGFGTLGEILSQAGIEDWQYIDIDIPPLSSIAKWYLLKSVGEEKVTGYLETKNTNTLEIENLNNVSVLHPWQLNKLRGNIDLFVNFISFQEMEPEIVENYLKIVSELNPKWILLRNLREGKPKKNDLNIRGVKTPILGKDYINMIPNYELVEKSTIPFGYLTYDNFHSEIQLFKKKD